MTVPFTDEQQIVTGARVAVKPWALLISGLEDPGIGIVGEIGSSHCFVSFETGHIMVWPSALEVVS